MAPEQWRGSKVGPAADLYGLGVVLYEMLAGQKPFRATEMPLLINKHLHEAPAPLRPCGGLDALVLQLLAKSEAERPATASEVVTRFDEILANLDWRVPSYAGAPARPNSHSATDPDLAPAVAGRPLGDATPSSPAGFAAASASGSNPSQPAAHMSTIGTHRDSPELMASSSRSSMAWLFLGGAAVLGAIAFSVWITTRGPSVETSASAPPGPAQVAPVEEQEKAVQRALSAAGLAREEASEFQAVATALLTWQAAVTERDAENGERALKPLLSALAAVRLDKDFLKAKLGRLQAEHGLLGRMVDRYPDKKDALEQRYGSYYTRLNAEDGPAQLRRLAQDIQAFLVELEELDGRAAAAK
jgi:hypothetical protein